MAVPWTINVDASPLTPGTTFDAIDLRTDSKAADSFTFAEHVPHYAGSYDEGQDVEFLYDGTRRFVGKILEKRTNTQGGQDTVLYRCEGARALARNVKITRRGPDETDPNAYPRRIYNAPADDPDSLWNSIATGSTVGEILTDLFDSFDTDLVAEGAIQTTGNAYNAGDLSALTFVPGKIVLDNLNFEAAVEVVLNEQGPAWGIWIRYSNGLWRFYDTTAPGTTLTYSLDADASYPVVDHQMSRDLKATSTAVKIYGQVGAGETTFPHQVGVGEDESGETLSGLTSLWDAGLEATWSKGQAFGRRHSARINNLPTADTFTVTPTPTWDVDIWIGGQVLFPTYSYTTTFTVIDSTAAAIQLSASVPSEVLPGDPFVLLEDGGGHADVFRKFQITDSAVRGVVQEGKGELDCCPHIQAILKNSSGDVLGVDSVAVKVLDDGVVVAEEPLFRSDSNGRNVGDSTLYPNFRLVYCYREANETTLSARYPTSGFAGEAYGAPWSVERESVIVAPEFEDVADLATFQALAAEIHKVASFVRARGSLKLHGIDWTPTDHRQVLRITHSTETTGWEALDVPVVGTSYRFLDGTTMVSYGHDGSSAGVDYRPLLEQIQRERATALGADGAGKTADYIRCQDIGRSRRATRSTLNQGGLEAPTFDTLSMVESTYHFPGIDCSANCSCDEFVNPCNYTQSEAAEFNQFFCMPDEQHGLAIHHPGDSSKTYCSQSQLLRFTEYPPQSLASSQDGMYFPFACKTILIGDHPLNQETASCGAFGTRDLVVVEPFDLDDSEGGDEIGVGSLLLLFIESYDHWMQRVQDSLCCLDEKFAKMDGDIWGENGTACGVGADCSIASAVVELYLKMKTLGECCSGIKQGEGQTRNCDIQTFQCNMFNGGPC